jgi:hypothetical protein
MAEPWQCPACKTWLAPHVSEHRCDPEDGVGAKPVVPAPASPAPGALTWTTQPGWTITTTNLPSTTSAAAVELIRKVA